MTEPELSEKGPPVRVADRVKAEYELDKWPAVEKLIEAECQSEPGSPVLARVLARVARWEYGPAGLHDAVIDGRRVQLPSSAVFGAVWNLIVERVSAACSDSTDLIVELGSGWGRNIVRIWLAGGPPAATYVAAEYTESGGRAASRLAALAPEMRFESILFDYNDPRALSRLEGANHAVVFSVHSIEQIPYVETALFDAIRRLAPRVTCLHFEPVGWQLAPSDRVGSSDAYARQHDYNRNLIETLREQEASGNLVIDEILPEVVGTNPANSTTVVNWHSPAR